MCSTLVSLSLREPLLSSFCPLWCLTMSTCGSNADPLHKEGITVCYVRKNIQDTHTFRQTVICPVLLELAGAGTQIQVQDVTHSKPSTIRLAPLVSRITLLPVLTFHHVFCHPRQHLHLKNQEVNCNPLLVSYVIC